MYIIYYQSIIYIHFYIHLFSPCGCISCSVPRTTSRISEHDHAHIFTRASIRTFTRALTVTHTFIRTFTRAILQLPLRYLLIRPHKKYKKPTVCRGKRSCWTTCKKSLGKGYGAFSGKRRHTRGNGIGGVLKIF